MSMSDGIDGHALGKPEHGADLAAQLAGIGLRAAEQLLDALGGLGHQALRARRRDRGRGSRPPIAGGGSTVSGWASGASDVRRRRRPPPCVAHRGPGAPLNWTGTRPTP